MDQHKHILGFILIVQIGLGLIRTYTTSLLFVGFQLLILEDCRKGTNATRAGFLFKLCTLFLFTF